MDRTLLVCEKVTAVKGAKILITGPAGQIAFPLAEYLAADNEVWGIARISDQLQILRFSICLPS